MSEQQPNPSEEIDRVRGMVDAARERVGDGITLGSIAVRYESPYWPAGEVWVAADCETCGAHVVMRTPGYEVHLIGLAHTVMMAFCDKSKHEETAD